MSLPQDCGVNLASAQSLAPVSVGSNVDSLSVTAVSPLLNDLSAFDWILGSAYTVSGS